MFGAKSRDGGEVGVGVEVGVGSSSGGAGGAGGAVAWVEARRFG